MSNTEQTINFRKVLNKDILMIFSWLDQPFIQEFWDNTPAHRDDILNFTQGRKTASSYANGQYVYWLGEINQVPYCMIMTILEKPSDPRPEIKARHLSTSGNTYGLDFMIGNKDYIGAGLGGKTLENFIEFFSTKIDNKANTFFIDPDNNNPRAKHVYEKAGFNYIGEFVMEGDGCFSGRPAHFLVKTLR